MATQVVWSESAVEDLEAIAEFIAENSVASAKKVVSKIRDAAINLEKFPHLGMVVPEMSDPSIRQSLVLKYRLIYQLQNDRLLILAILHARRKRGSTPK
jgi:plasmid stabilization system protein ParE